MQQGCQSRAFVSVCLCTSRRESATASQDSILTETERDDAEMRRRRHLRRVFG